MSNHFWVAISFWKPKALFHHNICPDLGLTSVELVFVILMTMRLGSALQLYGKCRFQDIASAFSKNALYGQWPYFALRDSECNHTDTFEYSDRPVNLVELGHVKTCSFYEMWGLFGPSLEWNLTWGPKLPHEFWLTKKVKRGLSFLAPVNVFWTV